MALCYNGRQEEGRWRGIDLAYPKILAWHPLWLRGPRKALIRPDLYRLLLQLRVLFVLMLMRN